MAKAEKKGKVDKKKRGNYEQPLQVDGTFMDIMKAAVKHRENNISAKKKDDKEK